MEQHLACLQPGALHARAKVESLAHRQLCGVQVHLQPFRIQELRSAFAARRLCERSELRCAQCLQAETSQEIQKRAGAKNAEAGTKMVQ